jgi:hypothetical protein
MARLIKNACMAGIRIGNYLGIQYVRNLQSNF